MNTLDKLFELNEDIVNELYGSAFCYGQIPEDEWKDYLTKRLNVATERGYELAKKIYR